MCRDFVADPLPEGLLEELLDQARRAPSAGNTQAVEFCVITNPDKYWAVTMSSQRRAGFWQPGLFRAPVLVITLTDPVRYLERYSEPNKAYASLGESLDAWGVPYWWVDAGMAVQNLLLGASANNLGACFFGVFAHEEKVKAAFGVPERYRIVGTVALGYPNAGANNSGASNTSNTNAGAQQLGSGASARRPRRPLQEVVHYDSMC
ncbi:MAG: nitroreductase family protein [bacterium]|nr:nitroreductase family protein [bacterium]MCY4163647.1 nitroreductase family protein [bacterium]